MSRADGDGSRLRLAGKVALVSGAGSGIGRAMARLFALRGARVVLVDLDEGNALEVAREIEETRGRALTIAADVTRAVDCRDAVEQTLDAFQRLDILCNNAGIIVRAAVTETKEADWDRLLATNAKSVFLMSRQVVPIMARQGGGVILNTASGWGLVGGPRAAAYCASKGAVVQLTRAMAIDHGPQNIRVNCICPGDTDTPMLGREITELGGDASAFLDQAAKRPLGRIGTPAEIARVALFLVSDSSSFVTGAAVVVDGGALAGG